MLHINFVKMHGLLNSFIVISDFSHFFSSSESPKLAQSVCSLQGGIGADGLVILRPAVVKGVDFVMDFYNADGSQSEMCGNAIRCLTKYVVDENLLPAQVKQSDKKNQLNSHIVRFHTPAGLIKTTMLENLEYEATVSVNMGLPVFDFLKKYPQGFDYQGYSFIDVSMGNPHAVSFVSDIDFDYRKVGEALQQESFFPDGVNVEFAKVVSDGKIDVRVIERGVGETYACGTGACAVAASYIRRRQQGVTNSNSNSNKSQNLKHTVEINLLGGMLTVNWSGDLQDSVEMIGPTKKITSGVYYY